MDRQTYGVALVLLAVSSTAAQEPGVLAIDEEAGRYAFSFQGEADALNMCGTTGCEVVATFSACLGLGHSSPTQGRSIWTWVEATTEGGARQGALDECERAGGPACAVLNAFCAEAPAVEAAAPGSAQENLFWESIRESTDPADFEAYLRQYPRGAFRALARNRLARLGPPASAAAPAAGARPEAAEFGGDSLCEERPRGVPCWMEVANRPGCYVWNPNPQPEETVTWTGGCSGGFAEGAGSLRWAFGGTEQVATGGRLQGGRMDGTWSVTEQGPDGRDPRRFEATFADGRPQAEEPAVEPPGQSAESEELPVPPPRPTDADPVAAEARDCASLTDSHAWVARPANSNPEFHGNIAWDALVENACGSAVAVFVKAAAWNRRNEVVARRQWHYEPNFWERLDSGETRWYCRDARDVVGSPDDDAYENGCGLLDSRNLALRTPVDITVTYSMSACWVGRDDSCEEPTDPEPPTR